LPASFLLDCRPDLQPVFRQQINQGQQLLVPLAKHGSGSQIPTILISEFAQTPPLLCWDHIGSAFALLGASDRPSRMQLTSGTSAIGFSTASFLEVEGTLDHRLSTLQPTEGAAHGFVGSPELLSDFRRICAQSARVLLSHVQNFKQIFSRISQS
jgi:hypothetical protein